MIKKYIIRVFLMSIMCDCFLLGPQVPQSKPTIFHRIYKELTKELEELKKTELIDRSKQEMIDVIQREVIFYEKIIKSLST